MVDETTTAGPEVETQAAPEGGGDAQAVSRDAAEQVSQQPEGEAADTQGEPEAEAEGTEVSFDDLQLPDGLEPDEELLGSFKETLKEIGVTTKEGAEKLLGLYRTALEKQYDHYQTTVRKQWREAAMKELGEDADKVIGTIRDALTEYAPDVMDDFIAVMDQTGLGDHPAVIKTIYALASKLSEGSFTPGGQAAAEVEPEDILYGKKEE